MQGTWICKRGCLNCTQLSPLLLQLCPQVESLQSVVLSMPSALLCSSRSCARVGVSEAVVSKQNIRIPRVTLTSKTRTSKLPPSYKMSITCSLCQQVHPDCTESSCTQSAFQQSLPAAAASAVELQRSHRVPCRGESRQGTKRNLTSFAVSY